MVALSFLRFQEDQDLERQRRYKAYREYYDGEHDTQLTPRLRAFLQLKFGVEFRTNYCPVVTDSLAERLRVTGFTAEGQEEILRDWWKINRMDAAQVDVMQASIRDGDAYVIVEWDEEENHPIFTMELAYDGSDGVNMHYSDVRRGEPLFASKQWKLSSPADGAGFKRRLNLYFEDRIEKYVSDAREFAGAWQHYQEAGEPWPIPWTRDSSEGGDPLGLPVIHFKYKPHGYNYGRSRMADALPLQNQLNKAIIDLIGGADASGFQILWATGDKFSAALEVGPGSVMRSDSPDARFGAIPPADLSGLLAYKKEIVIDIAAVTGTPLSRFQVSGQIAAEGTLKQQEAPLVADGETAALIFGNAWEDVLAMGRVLSNVFGKDTAPLALDEDTIIDTQWRQISTRDETDLANRMGVWAEKLSVADTVIWKRIGMTEEEIAETLASDQYQALKSGRNAMMDLGSEEDEEG